MSSAIRKKYLAVLGREPLLSLAELEALFGEVRRVGVNLAEFEADQPLIDRLGGTLKLAEKMAASPLEILMGCPEGKITLGVSDYSRGASQKSASREALKLKKILVRHGRSVRVVENKEAVLGTATSLHNGLSGRNPRKIELIKVENDWYRVVGVQDIDAYARRDQTRPARDAKVGMLPPKLAQILINLCGPLPENARILDPFCGTGVVLQEALLMGYLVYGTDLEPRMVEYTRKNLEWLVAEVQHYVLGHAPSRPLAFGHSRPKGRASRGSVALSAPRWSRRSLNHSIGLPQAAQSLSGPDRAAKMASSLSHNYVIAQFFKITTGDATNFKWQLPIDAVVCEGYLGRPMSQIPPEIKLRAEKANCETILRGFFKNLAPQIKKNIPVVVAVPAWLRQNGEYSRLNLIDFLGEMGYNVDKKTREGLFYHREGQIVARDIMILRKK